MEQTLQYREAIEAVVKSAKKYVREVMKKGIAETNNLHLINAVENLERTPKTNRRMKKNG